MDMIVILLGLVILLVLTLKKVPVVFGPGQCRIYSCIQ